MNAFLRACACFSLLAAFGTALADAAESPATDVHDTAYCIRVLELSVQENSTVGPARGAVARPYSRQNELRNQRLAELREQMDDARQRPIDEPALANTRDAATRDSRSYFDNLRAAAKRCAVSCQRPGLDFGEPENPCFSSCLKSYEPVRHVEACWNAAAGRSAAGSLMSR